MWMRSCAYWRRSCRGHCVRDVQTPLPIRSSSRHPSALPVAKKGVTASNELGQCHGESYQQQPNFHCVKRGEEGKKWNTFSTKLAPAWPQREKVGEKRDWIDEGCSISDLSLSLGLCLCVWTLACSHVGLALQVCLCLFNYCNSGPPAECLHLPLSEVRDGKILKERLSNLLYSSEIDPSC